MDGIWTLKYKLSQFTGADPAGWITRAEMFFADNEIHSCDKLQWAFMSMEDEEALLWFYSWCQENPDADWKSFSMAMIREFGAHMEHPTDKQMVQNHDQESEPKLWKMAEKHDEPVLEKIINDGEGRYVNEISPSSEKVVDAEMENFETKKSRKDNRIGGRVLNEKGTNEETKARRKSYMTIRKREQEGGVYPQPPPEPFPLNLKERSCKYKTLYVAWLFEGGLSGFQQWDPGGKRIQVSFFNSALRTRLFF